MPNEILATKIRFQVAARAKPSKSQSEEYGFNKKQCASKKQEQNRFIVDVIIIASKKESTTEGGQHISHKERHARGQEGWKTCSLEVH